MSGADLRDVLAELAARDTKGFHASYVATATGRDLREIQRELVKMVDAGDLTIQYQLLCPDDGSVIRRYGADDVLPIGEEIEADDCHPFVVEKRHVGVAYLPTRGLLSELLQEARSGKAPTRRRGLRRALSVLGIDSTKHRSSGPTSTTT